MMIHMDRESVETATSEVYRALRNVREYLNDGEETDVRVQLHLTPRRRDGLHGVLSVNVRSGDASYDTDHRGYWGSSSIASDDSDHLLRVAATEMMDEALESAMVAEELSQ